MSRDDALWQLEEQFWLGGADFYERALAPDALMVLPAPAGILDRAATIESIGNGARWRQVALGERHAAFAGPDTAILAYTANADRGARGSGYLARCSSTYIRAEDAWRLVLHHQTPIEAEADERS